MPIHVREEINKMTDRCQNFSSLRERQRETEREIESSVSVIHQGLFQHGEDTYKRLGIDYRYHVLRYSIASPFCVNNELVSFRHEAL